MLEEIKGILAVPVNALLVILLLPTYLVCRVVNGLAMLAELPNTISFGEIMTTVEFIRSDKTAEHRRQAILGAEFPNSIAVRS